jgi:hypothetical protein
MPTGRELTSDLRVRVTGRLDRTGLDMQVLAFIVGQTIE